MSKYVKVGKPTYHRKRKYFTLLATGNTIHEINLDYLTYPLTPVKPESVSSRLEYNTMNNPPKQDKPLQEEV